MTRQAGREPWDDAYDELLEVIRPPEPNDALDPGGHLLYRWLEEMGKALAPDHHPLVVAPLEFFLFNGCEPSWDEKLDAHSRFYERLKRQRAECDAAYNKLANVRVEPSWVRSKHWPLGGEGIDDIRKRVLASDPIDSCFYQGVTSELLTAALKDALVEDMDSWWPPPSHALVDVCAMTVIGCSGMGDTTFIRFDCSFDSLSAHAYPIDASEVSATAVSTPVLLGAVRT